MHSKTKKKNKNRFPHVIKMSAVILISFSSESRDLQYLTANMFHFIDFNVKITLAFEKNLKSIRKQIMFYFYSAVYHLKCHDGPFYRMPTICF